MLLLFSDGLSESTDGQGQEYGSQRIARILGQGVQAGLPPSAVLSSLRSDLLEHSGPVSLRDDCTAILMQTAQGVCAGSHGRGASTQPLELPRSTHKLHLLHQAIASLAADQPEDFVRELAQAACQAATHVVRHARTCLPDAPLNFLLEHQGDAISVVLVHAGEPCVLQDPSCPGLDPGSGAGSSLGSGRCSVDRVEYGRPMPGLASIALSKRLPKPLG